VCVNTLKRDWKPGHTLKHVLTVSALSCGLFGVPPIDTGAAQLQVIRCLLIEPFPDSALNEEAAMLMHEAFEDYEKQAKLMTEIHARAVEEPAEEGAQNVSAEAAGEKVVKKGSKKKAKRKDPLMRL